MALIARQNNGNSPALSAGARWVAFTNIREFGTIQIYDLFQKRLRKPVSGAPQLVLHGHMLFSPDGRLLVGAATFRETYVWEAFSGLRRATIPDRSPTVKPGFQRAYSPSPFRPMADS